MPRCVSDAACSLAYVVAGAAFGGRRADSAAAGIAAGFGFTNGSFGHRFTRTLRSLSPAIRLRTRICRRGLRGATGVTMSAASPPPRVRLRVAPMVRLRSETVAHRTRWRSAIFTE